MIPIIVPTIRINMPEDNNNGNAKPKISVMVLSCLGDRNGDNVASIRPSTKERQCKNYKLLQI